MRDEQPDLGELVYTRIFSAPPELVFDCMTMPEHLTYFWGPAGVTTPIDNITVDLRPGGVFETIMVNGADGAEYPMRGVFLEIERPSLLAWGEADVEGGMTTSIRFNDLGAGRTETVATQTNVPAMLRSPEAQAGMATSFDKLEAYLLAR